MWATLEGFIEFVRASPVAQQLKNLPAMHETQEMWVQSLGWEDSLRRKWQPTPVFLPGKSPGAGQPTVYGVTKSQTRLKWLNTLNLWPYCFYLMFWLFCLEACGVLATCTPALEAHSLNPWSAREVPAQQTCWRWPRGMPSRKGSSQKYILISFWINRVFPGGSVSRESACNADLGSILGSERSPGGGHGNPVPYSCLENLLDRGVWWATVHGGHKELDMTEATEHASTQG